MLIDFSDGNIKFGKYTDNTIPYSCINGNLKRVYAYINSNNTITDSGVEDWNETIKVIYYNDTEITA